MTRARKSNRPYVSATILERLDGVIDAPDMSTHGKHAVVTVFRQMASKGYKTDYQRIEERIIEVQIDGEPLQRFRYTGKRLAVADQQLAEIRPLII
jgi:hypothetical protein